MSQFARVVVSVCFTLWVGLASGHPHHGDGPPVTREDLPALGQRAMVALVEAKQLAPSWQGKAAKDVRSEQTRAGLIWVLSYENPAETDRAKRTVYIFFDEFGNFLGGNHSGKVQ
jgi:Family of unknown function (DUF6488)